MRERNSVPDFFTRRMRCIGLARGGVPTTWTEEKKLPSVCKSPSRASPAKRIVFFLMENLVWPPFTCADRQIVREASCSFRCDSRVRTRRERVQFNGGNSSWPCRRDFPPTQLTLERLSTARASHFLHLFLSISLVRLIEREKELGAITSWRPWRFIRCK